MAREPFTEGLAAPRGMQFESGVLSSGDWSGFRQRALGILRQSRDPQKCLSLMRSTARGFFGLNLGEVKEDLPLRVGGEEPVRPVILPLNIADQRDGFIQKEGDLVTHDHEIQSVDECKLQFLSLTPPALLPSAAHGDMLVAALSSSTNVAEVLTLPQQPVAISVVVEANPGLMTSVLRTKEIVVVVQAPGLCNEEGDQDHCSITSGEDHRHQLKPPWHHQCLFDMEFNSLTLTMQGMDGKGTQLVIAETVVIADTMAGSGLTAPPKPIVPPSPPPKRDPKRTKTDPNSINNSGNKSGQSAKNSDARSAASLMEDRQAQ